MYRLLILGLGLLAYSPCMQTQNEIAKKNINEDDQSVSLREVTRITVGNDYCRADHACGYHGYSYSWCYKDNSWDYCCVGPCQRDGSTSSMVCNVGDRTKLCGDAGMTTVAGTTCISTHRCGLHGKGVDFWCNDNSPNKWNYCCSPLSKCSSQTYGKCTVNYTPRDSWTYPLIRSCYPRK